MPHTHPIPQDDTHHMAYDWDKKRSGVYHKVSLLTTCMGTTIEFILEWTDIY